MPLTDEQFAEWISERTGRVEARLKETVSASDSFVEEAARYLLDAGGKLFRPALTIAAGGLGLDANGVDEEGLIDAAVVVELTHVASLYHDDVMDEAELRRGGPAAHMKWGNSVAIMTGDFMLAQASLVGARLGEDFMVYQAGTLARLVRGQIAELRGPEPGTDELAHHLSVVSNKTAALIAASARYGGVFASLPPAQISALTEYGENLGMAFQLADDLLDIFSEDSGKALGTDLREGVPTLTTLLIRRHARPEDARLVELLRGPVADEDIPEVLALLSTHPAIDEARAQIRQWADQALSCLDGFPDVAPTRTLRMLCDQAAVRTN